MTTKAMDIAPAVPRRLPVLPLVVGLYATGAALMSPAVYADTFLTYAHQTLLLPPLVLVGLILAGVIARPRAPLAYSYDLARTGLLRLLAIFAIFCAGLAAFTTYKIAIPHLVPFYADPLFADLDAWLHFGNPGEWIHAILPGWLHYPLAWTYGQLWFLLWFGLVAVVAFHKDAAFRRRYFWSMALTVCVLGTILAALMSSVGPILYREIYGTDRYAALMGMIDASSIGAYMREASGYLLDNYRNGTHDMGTGISAMPSMHLAIATLNALMLRRLNRVLGIVAFIYLSMVLVCSVFLGWHYAIDGYVSIGVVALIWWTTGRVFRREQTTPII